MSEAMEYSVAQTISEEPAAQESMQEETVCAMEHAMEEENPMAVKRRQWSAFVEGPAADFFTGYKLEKMTIDDGSGNKAKFSRTKDAGIKVEYTSAVLL